MYRATRDGFSADEFHSRCDNMGKTLTIIKTENGNVFGGYAETKWRSTSGYMTDSNSFLFSLINTDENLFKSMKNGYCFVT